MLVINMLEFKFRASIGTLLDLFVVYHVIIPLHGLLQPSLQVIPLFRNPPV